MSENQNINTIIQHVEEECKALREKFEVVDTKDSDRKWLERLERILQGIESKYPIGEPIGLCHALTNNESLLDIFVHGVARRIIDFGRYPTGTESDLKELNDFVTHKRYYIMHQYTCDLAEEPKGVVNLSVVNTLTWVLMGTKDKDRLPAFGVYVDRVFKDESEFRKVCELLDSQSGEFQDGALRHVNKMIDEIIANQ